MCSCIQAGKVLPGDGLENSCHRRRDQLQKCLKKQKQMRTKNTAFHFSVVALLNRKKRYIEKRFLKNTLTLIDGGALKKYLPHSTRKNSNHLEPRFQSSATKSRCLEDKISFSTSLICTKHMLGRAKTVKTRLETFLKGNALS